MTPLRRFSVLRIFRRTELWVKKNLLIASTFFACRLNVLGRLLNFHSAIPLVDLKAQRQAISEEIEAALAAVVERCDFILGEEVSLFESEFAEYCGVPFAVAVASGTDALHLACRALNIGDGDEVIVPAMTFASTAFAVSLAGARPVIVDVREDDALIDPEKIEGAITSRTKAIIPVHLYGQCADMETVCAIARDHSLAVIEDAAQAHGAVYAGKRAGRLGDIGCFSFYPGKNLGAYGDGGLVTTARRDIAECLQLLRNCGSRIKYHHEKVGLNSRLDTLQAAILRAKLTHLEQWNAARQRIAGHYNEALRKISEVRCTPHRPGSVHHLYVIRLHGRDSVLQALSALPRCLLELSLVLAATLSTMVIFALERANFDVLLFVMALATGVLAECRLFMRMLGYFVALGAALLKYYPIMVLIIVFRELVSIFVAVSLMILGFLAAFWAEYYAEIARGLPTIAWGPYNTDLFAAKNLPFLLGEVAGNAAEPSGWAPLVQRIVAGGLYAILVGSSVVICRRLLSFGELRGALASLTRLDRVFLVIGSAVIAGCFFGGQSIGYRGVFFLLVMPGLLAISRTSSADLRKLSLGTSVVIVLLMWGECFRLALYHALEYPGVPDMLAGNLKVLFWFFRELGWWWTISVMLAVLADFLLDSPTMHWVSARFDHPVVGVT